MNLVRNKEKEIFYKVHLLRNLSKKYFLLILIWFDRAEKTVQENNNFYLLKRNFRWEKFET